MVINKRQGWWYTRLPGIIEVHSYTPHWRMPPICKVYSGEVRPGVVHRWIKIPSGLILMAKNDKTHHWLQEQFRQRQVKKYYLALVDGKPPTPTGRVEVQLGEMLLTVNKWQLQPPVKVDKL
jgi:23S rRNA-/tRNA-specific pseudouridylate synthase